MTLSEFFHGLGDLFQWTFQIFEMIGNNLNDAFLLLGFFGFIFWMTKRRQTIRIN
jgi:hypothetical protein